ncbi:MAG: ABA4-like family protein [Pirellulaceae bacterium]|nr:ABA4-like family protein [Pirellulaceae bacterium]
MDFSQAFKIANTLALVSWILLAFLPRYPGLIAGLRYGVISAFAVIYVSVVAMFFTSIEGGGFNTLQEVKNLMAADAGAFAGWVHYLAFDLFIGLWIAESADRLKLHRVLQIPILLATFMFGPLGLLLFYGVDFGLKRAAGKKVQST